VLGILAKEATMLRKTGAALAAATTIALGGALMAAMPVTASRAAAQTVTAPVSDVSSQQHKNQANQPHRAAPRAARPAAHPAARPAARPAVRPARPAAHPVRPAARPAHPVVRAAPKPGVVRHAPARVVTRPAGPARVIPARHGPRISVRVVGGGPIRIGGRRVTIVRGPRYVTWRGHRRSLVPIAVLTGLTIGAVAYSAYGYLPVEQNYCDGFTEDGCQLQWTDVPTEEGDVVPQCVTYCPIP
jgi:hypothetical protein